MTIRAVLFDLGDTLWHFPKLPPLDVLVAQGTERSKELLRRWGFNPDGQLETLARDAYYTAQSAEMEAYRSHLKSPDPAVVLREVAAQRGAELTPEQAQELWEACTPSGQVLSRTPYEDAVDTLRWVREQGYRLGVITNTLFGGQPLRNEFVEEGFDRHVEVLIASCDVGYMKPHPQIFRLALDALGVSPEETVMVGDSLYADVGGAKPLGMTAVWKRRTDAQPQWERQWQAEGIIPTYEPDYVVDRLWEITELRILNHD